jgi:hypothetical protein
MQQAILADLLEAEAGLACNVHLVITLDCASTLLR